jgi:tetratricopeptide (TPR) repeat protein
MSASPGGAASVDVERARALCDLARFGDAAQLLQRVVAADPQNARAWCLLAQARLGGHEDSDALRASRTALSLAPDDEWPHRLHSIALGKLGRRDESIAAARSATGVAPHSWQAFVQLAQALLGAKSAHQEALGAAEQAVALAPHEAATHIVLGMAARACKRHEEADAAFRAALAIDPQNSVAHNELARLRLRRSKLAGATALADAAGGFTNAVRANPRADVSRRNLDLVVRVFLARVSYLIFLDAYLAGRGLAGSGSVAARLAPVVLLAVPAQFAWRFVRRLSPDLRRHVRRVLLSRALLIPAVLQAVAIALLLAAVVVPRDARSVAAGAAAAAAAVARLYLFVYAQRRSRVRPGLRRFVSRALGRRRAAEATPDSEG